MTTSDHATLYCRFVETVVNRHCLDNVDQFLEAMPDAHVLMEDLVEGNHLMARLAATSNRHEVRRAAREPRVDR